jgi:hypothetical protein
MDPATIAASVLTVLTPYLRDAGKEVLKTAGEVALGKAKDLLKYVRERLSGDPVAAKDLSRYESNPETFEPVLKSALEEKMQADPAFALDLRARVDDLRSDLQVFQQIKEGRDIVGIDADLMPGTANVRQEADKVQGMTGIRIRSKT